MNILNKIFSPIVICVIIACQSGISDIDLSQISWTYLTESIGFYSHIKTDTGLNDKDSIRIEIIGILDKEQKLHKLEENFEALSFPIADTIKLYHLNPIWSKLTMNSETYVRIDHSAEYSRMIAAARIINLRLADLNPAQIDSLVNSLNAKKYLSCVEYISKEKAAIELRKELGEDYISLLGYNPLSDQISLQVKNEYLNSNSFEEIKNDLKQIASIETIDVKDIGAIEKLGEKSIKIIKITCYH